MSEQYKSITAHLNLLGMRVEDRVTKYKGVVVSVCFDLYGCIQALLNPGVGSDGRLGEQFWLDVSRLEVLNDKPVMSRPDYISGLVAEGKHGPSEKPKMNKS